MTRRRANTGVVTSPFVVAIDQREKLPYAFASIVSDASEGRRPVEVATTPAFLPSGDYSIVGHEPAIAIERKSLADLYGTLGQHRDRFERELVRLAGMAWAAVVVEAEWSEVLQGSEHSQLDPKTIYRSVIAWQQRMPVVHWWFVAGRPMAEVTVYRLLERWWKDRSCGREGM
jgi:ERCC4-type nuclease